MDFPITSIITWKEIFFTILRLIAVTTSILNIIVFLNPVLKDSTYRLLLITSIIELIYSFLLAMYYFIQEPFCIFLCTSGNQFIRCLLIILVENYLTSCLFVMNILIELWQSLKRLFLISNKKSVEKITVPIAMIIICFVSCIFYAPVMFLKKIVYSNETQHYKLENTEFGKTDFGRLIPFILSIIRLQLATTILIFLNIFTFFRFKKYFMRKSILNDRSSITTSSNFTLNYGTKSCTVKRKIKIRSSIKASKNITLMLISISVLFSIGTLPLAMYYALSDYFQVKFEFKVIMFDFATFCLYLFIIIKLAIYYIFNKMYRKILKNYFKRLICSIQNYFHSNYF